MFKLPDSADRKYYLLLLFFVFLPNAASIALLFVLSTLSNSGWAPGDHLFLFYGVATLLMAFGLSTTTFVSIISGFLFGWTGTLWVVVSYSLAALLSRFFMVWLNQVATGSISFSNPKAARLFKALEGKPFLLLLFCRLSPVLPFAMTNMALGRMKFKIPVFVLGTLAGMLPRSLIFIYTGSQAQNLSQAMQRGNGHWTDMAVPLAFIVISLVGISLLVKKAINRISSETKSPSV